MKLVLQLALASGCALLVTLLAAARPQPQNGFVREPVVVFDNFTLGSPFGGDTSLIVYNDGHVVYVQTPGSVFPGTSISKAIPQPAVQALTRQLRALGAWEKPDLITDPGLGGNFTLTLLAPHSNATSHTFSWNGLSALAINIAISSFIDQFVLAP